MIQVLAYLVPASAALGLLWGGAWAWLTVFFVYGIVPVADALGGADARNLDEAAQQRAAASRWAAVPLYLALPVQLGLFALLAVVWQGEAAWWERAGWIASTAITCGGLGIVIGHELVHRRDRREYWLGKLLLGTVLYMHFAIEHVRGHHPRVGTDDDPASARRGQTVYGFIPGSVLRQFTSAWDIEATRLAIRPRRAVTPLRRVRLHRRARPAPLVGAHPDRAAVQPQLVDGRHVADPESLERKRRPQPRAIEARDEHA